MTKSPIMAGLLTCALWGANAHAQTRAPNLGKLEALQERYNELAARYRGKCETATIYTEIDRDIHLIEQGGVLASDPIMFPMARTIVRTLRSLQQQLTDGVCARATDYGDLSQMIGDILDEDNAKHR